RNERRFFDIWTNFTGRSYRNGITEMPGDDVRIEQIKIQAAIDPDLSMKAVTRLRVVPKRAERALPFELSQQMQITQVKIDGAPGEVFYPESLRANLLRSADNNLVLVAGDREFAAGTPVEVEVHHEGKVITSAGDKVYFVGARGAWYPNLGQQLAE